MESKKRPALVRFANCEVDLPAGEIRKAGIRIRIQHQPFKILAALLERPGEVVTREELRARIWPTESFGDFDQAVNIAVTKLRGALGDSAENPRFIQTLPRRGYRFIAAVEQAPPSSSIIGKRMLVVLPFENLGDDAEQDYFADGLTEELIAQLGQLNPKRLGVIARTSAVQYKRTKKPVREIAKELHVEYVLEGSVRREGDRVRITAQLIEVADETHLWSESYDRELRDVLGVQADVARHVGRALRFELLPEPPRVTASPEAQEAFLRGRFFWGMRSEEALLKALAFFEQALSLDPNFGRAYSGIADCCGLLCWFGTQEPREAGPRAAKAARRALELDGAQSEAHASMALVFNWFDWNWKSAEDEFRRAIGLNPSYAPAHHWYSSYLNSLGRVDEARTELQRARECDPLSLIISMSAADPYFFSRQYDRAIEHLEAVLEHAPRFAPAFFNLGRVHAAKGMYEEAIVAFEKAAQLSGNREAFPALAHAYAKGGREAEARSILEEMRKESSGRHIAAPLLARIHLGLGEKDRAIERLRQGLEERSLWMTMLKMDPVYDEIREDTRFRELVKLVGFPD
jgi:TolB-like protein/Flp pilus assembly protein TadD